MAVRHFRKRRRFKRRKSILRNRFFWLGFLIFFVIGTVFYFFFFSEIFQIKEVIISGNEKISRENLELTIRKKLENKMLFFKTGSIFLADLEEIESEILNSFPQISEIKVSREFPDIVSVALGERRSLAVWCKESNCFLIDGKGIIFDPVSSAISEETGEILPESNLPKIVDKKEMGPFSLGEKVIEENVLKLIPDIKEQLSQNFEINTKEFVIPNPDRLDVKIIDSWEIYFNTKEDIDWQLTKLSLVLKEEILPEKIKDLEYIDLRFSRVYYKYK